MTRQRKFLLVTILGLSGTLFLALPRAGKILNAQTPAQPTTGTRVPKSSPKPSPQTSKTTSKNPILVGAGDIANCATQEDMLTAQLIEQIPGTVFTTGDNVYQIGSAEEFQKCYEPTWGRFKDRTRPSPGNHDYYSTDAKPYYAYFGNSAGPSGKGYYSYTLGNWHIVSLNSNISGKANSPQDRWLKADLAANRRTCTLAYWHHPVFSSGVHGNDSGNMRDIWKTLYDAGVEIVLNGHEHNYERFAPQTSDGKAEPTRGIRQFIVGTGGTSLRPLRSLQPNSEVHNTDDHGVLKLTLRPNDYDWEFIPIPGKTFRDQGTAKCVALK
jgi:acid phosphatase type 7